MATEEEIQKDFPTYELGAIPPLGLYGVPGARVAMLVATGRPSWRAPVLLVAALQYAVVQHSSRWKGLRPLATSSG